VLRERPEKILVVGAGAIGIEFAYFYHSFGAEVTVVELLDAIVPLEDQEISKTLQRSFEKRGIVVKTKTSVDSLARKGENISAVLSQDGKIEEWCGDYCLVAVGVQGNVENLGLEEVGLQAERSFIPVDQYYRTRVPGIYAIGDLTGPPLLAHVASHEGIIAAEHIAGAAPHPLEYENVAACTYCQPQVASVGLTEQAARDAGKNIAVGRFPFTASGKAVATDETEGMVKVIIDKELEEVLGVHILHAEATELIAEASIIRTHEGIASSVLNTVHAHPTLSEAVMEAMAVALGRPIHI
jgi:dihydrolipoamide dehydrogenase